MSKNLIYVAVMAMTTVATASVQCQNMAVEKAYQLESILNPASAQRLESVAQLRPNDPRVAKDIKTEELAFEVEISCLDDDSQAALSSYVFVMNKACRPLKVQATPSTQCQ